jgi:hypothetical protein
VSPAPVGCIGLSAAGRWCGGLGVRGRGSPFLTTNEAQLRAEMLAEYPRLVDRECEHGAWHPVLPIAQLCTWSVVGSSAAGPRLSTTTVRPYRPRTTRPGETWQPLAPITAHCVRSHQSGCETSLPIEPQPA